jgi:hypothetical protein
MHCVVIILIVKQMSTHKHNGMVVPKKKFKMFFVKEFREIKYTFLHNALYKKEVRFVNEPSNLYSVCKSVTSQS